jgi:hypothetical protein
MAFWRRLFGKPPKAKGEKVESAERHKALQVKNAEFRGSEKFQANDAGRYNFAEYQAAGIKDRRTRGATVGPKVDTPLKQVSVPLRSPHNQSSQNRNIYPETSSGQKRSGWERRPAATHHPSLLQERTNPRPQAGPRKAARGAPSSQDMWCDPSLLSGNLSGNVPGRFQDTTGLQALASCEKTYMEADRQWRGVPGWEAYIRRADY